MAYHPFRHLGLKFVSVAIAVMLWLTISGEQVVERSFRAPLELQNKPEQLELLGEPPSSVDVRVRGSSGALASLGAGEVVAVLDLGSARPGRRLFNLMTEYVRVPHGVEVTYVSPATVQIAFERSASRMVPVVPQVEGDPAPGFMGAEVSAEPAMVEVVGPESLLQQLTEAITEPVSIDGARESIREIVTVGLMDPSLRLKVPRSATVSVNIVPIPIDREILAVAVAVRNLGPSRSAVAVPQDVAVTARGPGEIVNGLSAGSVRAFVDASGLGPGRYSLPVEVEPGEGTTVVRTSPSTVRVRIR
jgi:YbbR domain-containing protein